MKITSSTSITAAEVIGTVFYEVTEDQLKSYYDESVDNMISKYLVREYGFDAFDLDRMYGSAVVDDNLYICVTDGDYIEIDGYEINPEDALQEYSIEDLQAFIQPADDEIMKRYVSSYEFKTPDMDEVALELLTAGHSFYQIVEDANELDLMVEYY